MSTGVSTLFPVEPALWNSSRARPLSQNFEGVRARELTALALCGIAAAVAAALDDGISKVPGHAILRSVLPVLCGLALVPRRGSGTFMSLWALGTTMFLKSFVTMSMLQANVGRQGFGNVAGMVALGPALDLALVHARGGWTIYLRCLAAGVGANLVAWSVRFGAAAFGISGGGGGGGKNNLTFRLVSHIICGALAGLIGAAIFFRIQQRKSVSDTGAAIESEPGQ